MPTYDYLCRACGHRLEIFQSITENAKRKCPECGKLKLERQIGAGAGILFKGSGFYETDYRSDSYRKAAKSEASSGSESSSGSGDASTKKSADAPKQAPGDAKPKKKNGSGG